MNLSFKSKNSIHLFIRSVVIFFFIGKIISLPLWLADRLFPLIPYFDFLTNFPNQIHLLLLFFSLTLMIVCFVKPSNSISLAALLFIEIISCLLDQNRWQPWVYQYIFMIFVLLINKKKETLALQLLLIILSSTYFYSGLQKINPHFLSNIWRKNILESFFHLPTTISQTQILIRLGYIVPLLEIGFGVCLLIEKYRKKIIIALIIWHCIILIFIIHLGINYNKIVCPWNFAMIVFLLIIYHKNINIIPLFKPLKPSPNWITLVAWIVLPLLNFVGYWDYYFSSSLYSARVDTCFIKIKNAPNDFTLSKFYEPIKQSDSANLRTIVIQNWALAELNVPACPQARVYKKIKENFRILNPEIDATFYLIDNSTSKTIVSEMK